MRNFKWVQDPGGRTCFHSALLDGQVDTLQGWQSNIMPGSTNAACEGNCDCQLVPTEEKESENKNIIGALVASLADLAPLKVTNQGNIVNKLGERPKRFSATRPDGRAVSGSYESGDIAR